MFLGVMMVFAAFLWPSSGRPAETHCKNILAMVQSRPQDIDMDSLEHEVLQDKAGSQAEGDMYSSLC